MTEEIYSENQQQNNQKDEKEKKIMKRVIWRERCERLIRFAEQYVRCLR